METAVEPSGTKSRQLTPVLLAVAMVAAVAAAVLIFYPASSRASLATGTSTPATLTIDSACNAQGTIDALGRSWTSTGDLTTNGTVLPVTWLGKPIQGTLTVTGRHKGAYSNYTSAEFSSDDGHVVELQAPDGMSELSCRVQPAS